MPPDGWRPRRERYGDLTLEQALRRLFDDVDQVELTAVGEVIETRKKLWQLMILVLTFLATAVGGLLLLVPK